LGTFHRQQISGLHSRKAEGERAPLAVTPQRFKAFEQLIGVS
jgi:hypothetical protein